MEEEGGNIWVEGEVDLSRDGNESGHDGHSVVVTRDNLWCQVTDRIDCIPHSYRFSIRIPAFTYGNRSQ